jgi:predicted nucleotidyltransferase
MDYINQISSKTSPVFQKYRIKKAIIFGSVARGTYTRRSDIDLILIQETDKRYFERFEGLLEALYEAITGRDIEVFIYTPEEFSNISHRKFIQRALREGKVIYES